MLRLTFILISLSFIIVSCGNSRSFTTYYSTESDSLYQFSDEEIQKIYESKPQIEVPIKLSFYSPSSELHTLVDSLKNNNEIENVYEIPEALVQGDVFLSKTIRRYFMDFILCQLQILLS